MTRNIKKVAIDLTPVLPGGKNGGAKIFVIELLKCLAENAPSTEFILLTQSASHEELIHLDRANVRRHLTDGRPSQTRTRLNPKALALRFLPYLPGRLRNLAARIGYQFFEIFRHHGQGASLLKTLDVDLLFCPFTDPKYWEADVPTVCSIYDLQYKKYPEFFSPEEVIHRDNVFLNACKRATMLAAISDYSRTTAIHHGKIDPLKIRTVYLRLAQRLGQFGNKESGLLRQYGLINQRYFIYPANFWRHKNHVMLITAFGIACRAGLPHDIKLVCTGDELSQQDYLRSASLAMGLADRIIFTGYVPDNELTDLMAACMGVVFPSLYEGFGIPMVEAMALGVPLACSNATSLPEVVGDAAILFDPRSPTELSDAMVLLANSKATRDRLIQAGTDRAKNFSNAEIMAEEYWDLFQSAVSQKKNEQAVVDVDRSLPLAYPDGWLSNFMRIPIESSQAEQTLNIQVRAHKWQPQSEIVFRVKTNENSEEEVMVLKRGSSKVFSIPIKPNQNVCEISILPTFSPFLIGQSGDKREISAFLSACSLVRPNGDCVSLYSSKTTS